MSKRFNEQENLKNKEVIINYVINSNNDENKNKKQIELIGIDTNNFVKYNVSNTNDELTEEYKKSCMIVDRRLKYRVMKAIKNRRIVEKIRDIFKIQKKVLLLDSASNNDNCRAKLQDKFSEIIAEKSNNKLSKGMDIYE